MKLAYRTDQRFASTAGSAYMSKLELIRDPMQPTEPDRWHATTILTVRKGGVVAIAGDGQVSIGQTIVKGNAKKVRRLGKGDVIAGFAGATADAFTLFERLESKLEQYPGQLTRAAVELAKDWRTDRYLRRLEAMMIVADKEASLGLPGPAAALVREHKRKEGSARAHLAAEERVINALVGPNANPATKDSFRKKLRANELDDKEIEIEVQAGGPSFPLFEIPGMPGAQMGAVSIGDIFGKLGGGRTKTRRVLVRDSYEILINEESDKMLDQDQLVSEALRAVENNGIVFLDELDKICARDGRIGADVSRDGVQRDLLPLIEGTTVSTKHGTVKTDHILFIASGAFHVSKPSDLLPELQGRLPIRVELRPLSRDDFRKILTEPEASLIKQTVALLATEGVELQFTADAIDAIADIAVEVNGNVENIGARRLQTVMERVLDEISFAAPDRSGETVKIDAAYVREHIGDLAKNADLSRFIL